MQLIARIATLFPARNSMLLCCIRRVLLGCSVLLLTLPLSVWAIPRENFFGTNKGQPYPSQLERETREHSEIMERLQALETEQKQANQLLQQSLVQQQQTNGQLMQLVQIVQQLSTKLMKDAPAPAMVESKKIPEVPAKLLSPPTTPIHIQDVPVTKGRGGQQ